MFLPRFAVSDDRSEKAARLQSRQALQELQLNQIRAAASPARKLQQANYERAASSSPRTPRSAAAEARRKAAQPSDTASPGALNVVSGSAATPMKRIPILANFEEWMKMATDNKINATNSWNFALIDYFHDMSLLKEGDGVNFQKASCTLDGCVKIYTSRVDSVATETGKLLSGLADTGDKRKKATQDDAEENAGDEGDGGGDDDEEEEGGKKKPRKKVTRSHEATLAPSFASLQLKKMELEFAVDPLFKKASADFDEGGAKGLLLNHLSINSEGRIVFDSGDDLDTATSSADTKAAGGEHGHRTTPASEGSRASDDIDLTALAARFFPDLSVLDTQDLCPSMKTFTLGDSNLTPDFLKAPDDWREANREKSVPPPTNINLADQTGLFIDGTIGAGFDDDDDDDDDAGVSGGFDVADNVGFGEGGEAWAKDAALEPMLRVSQADEDNGGKNGQDEASSSEHYTVSLSHKHRADAEHETILAYFDKAFNSRSKKAMASLEHWRIGKIQQMSSAPLRRERKEKEPFLIDFRSPMSQELQDLLGAPPASNASISLPRGQWKTRGRNLLDKDDEVFDTKSLLRLWLKPKAKIRRRKRGWES